MLKQEEIPKYLLPKEYVLEHGMPDDQLVDEYYIDDNGVYQYGQWLDKPLDEGGKPYNGVAYLRTEDGEYSGYQEYKNGYPYGVGVSFYPDSGRMAHFTYENTEENAEEYSCFQWYENGVLQKTVEEYIKRVPGYEKTKEYDESGRLVKVRVSFRPTLFADYDFDHPDPAFEVLLHENGEIRLIRKLSPSHYSFISECEFDAEGKLVRFALNPHYDPDFSSPEHEAAHRHIKTFDASFREQGGVLKKAVIYSPNRKHSRTVEFDRSGNVISEHADSI